MKPYKLYEYKVVWQDYDNTASRSLENANRKYKIYTTADYEGFTFVIARSVSEAIDKVTPLLKSIDSLEDIIDVVKMPGEVNV